MTIFPIAVRYGVTRMDVAFATKTERYVFRIGPDESPVWPAAHFDTTSFEVQYGRSVLSGTGTASVGDIALAIVEDTVDVNGDFFTDNTYTTLTPGVVTYIEWDSTTGTARPPDVFTVGDNSTPINGDPGAIPAVLAFNAPITKAGTYRMVVIVGSVPGHCRRRSNVGTGALGTDYHYDSDRSNSSGGATTVSSGNWVDAVVGRTAVVSALVAESPADNQKPGDTPNLDLTLAAAGSPGAGFVNPKAVRLAITDDAAGTTRRKTFDVTPSTAGQVDTAPYAVDGAFPTDAADYFLQLGVNDTLGNATTPAGQQPGIYGTAGTGGVQNITNTQRSWLLVSGSGHGSGLSVVTSRNQVRDAGLTTIGTPKPSGASLLVPLGAP